MTIPQSIPQWTFIILLVLYAILFVFFSRILYWKFYSERKHYRKRPKGLSRAKIAEMADQAGREIPYFSIFVPARNEADVIEKTVDHLSQLRYSPDHYEILVVTDEKEAQAADTERAEIVEALTPFLAGEAPWPGGEKHDTVLIALLSRLSLEEAELAERKAGAYLSIQELLTLPSYHRQQILQNLSLSLTNGKGKTDRFHLHETIARGLPHESDADVERLYPIFLSFAIPTVMAAAYLKNEETDKLANRLMSAAAQARQPLTQKVLTALSETVGSRTINRIQNATMDTLSEWVAQACVDALPITQEIVERKRMEFAAKRDLPALKHVIVPWDFDGQVDGVCTGHFVPSTKGRALNYSFRFADERSEVWAFYDAESRPDREVLLYVAWRRLTVGDEFQIAQGPVFQIRNFWKTSPICKIAGLYQAVSHEWQIPYLLKSVPFIGGTNIFSTRDLMLKIRGFDNTVLTEDMELGARAWLVGDAWPEFLPYASSEQTPPAFRAFFRQRLRWGSGYLQVYDKIKSNPTYPADRRHHLLKTYWWKGHFSWVLFQGIALLPFIVAILAANHLLDYSAAPWQARLASAMFGPFYLAFTYYAFFHYYKYMDPAPKRTKVTGFAHILTLPVSAFFLPVPYTSALILKLLGRQPKGWVKTPRTKE